jgi:hypothetical protein
LRGISSKARQGRTIGVSPHACAPFSIFVDSCCEMPLNPFAGVLIVIYLAVGEDMYEVDNLPLLMEEEELRQCTVWACQAKHTMAVTSSRPHCVHRW